MDECWKIASEQPARKLRYNLTVTSLSVVIALFVAGVELLGRTFRAPFMPVVHGIVDNLGLLDVSIVAMVAASWAALVAIHRAKGVCRAETVQ